MTSDSGSESRSAADAHRADPDAAHLDDDPEALEDPVHCGDAKHQRDLHEQAANKPD